MTVLAWLPIALLVLTGSDVAWRLLPLLTPAPLLGMALLGLCAGWTARPWQPPAVRRQVRACGLSFGMLCLHTALGDLRPAPGVYAAEWLIVCALIALWLPHRTRHKRSRKATLPPVARPPRHNRAIPMP